jgi:hypothetical protein
LTRPEFLLPLGLIEKLVSWKFIGPTAYLIDITNEEPDPNTFRSDRVLIEMRGPYPKWAHFRCPCPCNEPIAVPIANDRHSWRLRTDFRRRPTLHPSIHQTRRCGAHFWMIKGDIVWCVDSGLTSNRMDKIT